MVKAGALRISNMILAGASTGAIGMSAASSGACPEHQLGHHLGMSGLCLGRIWSMSGASSGPCLGNV